MALEYTLWLNNPISNKMLINKIKSLGMECYNIEYLTSGLVIDLSEELGFWIYLIDIDDNTWETDLFEIDFVFKQSLSFRMDKEYKSVEKRYNIILKIIFEIMEEMKNSAILVNSGSEELCFFYDGGKIILNNESGIWDQKCFRDIIVGRKVSYL